MTFIELKLANENILVNIDKVQSVMPTKQIDGTPATLLITGDQQFIVSDSYEDIKERIKKYQDRLWYKM